MTLDKLKDVLINMGFKYSEDNGVSYLKINDLEYFKYQESLMYVLTPFLTVNYFGKQWFDGDFKFVSSVACGIFNGANPLMITEEDLDGYSVINIENGIATCPFTSKLTEENCDDIAKLSTFIVDRVVNLQNKQKMAKFKFKIKYKNQEELVEQTNTEHTEYYKSLHTDYINEIIDNPEVLYKNAELLLTENLK